MTGGRRTSGTLDILLTSLLATSGKLSGYQVAALLGEPIPLIWPVKHSQIYPALAALEARGDIVGEWIEQRGRPNKKVYRLSDQGRERLVDWLLQPRETISEDEIMLITYNIALIGSDAVREALASYRLQCEMEMAQLEERWTRALPASHERVSPDAAFTLELIGVRTIYEFALSARHARIAWCESVLDRAETTLRAALEASD